MGHMVMCHATTVGDNVMLANASVINDGVKVGNPVVNNWGMVGRVVDLGQNASRVLLTVDINSQIPVYFENSLHR